MNQNMAAKLSSLHCFEQAFWVIFCPDVCSYFGLVCGGRGHSRVSDRGPPLNIKSDPFPRMCIGAPGLGSAERGPPDLFRFPRSLPICSDLRSLFSGMFRFAPICSGVSLICSDLFSE